MRWIKKKPEPDRFKNWKNNFKTLYGRDAVYDDLKGTFQACISPADPKIRGIFGFKLDGKMFAKDPIGQEMARHINLNSYVLEEQRKAALDTVLDIEFENEDLLNDRDYMEAVVGDYESMQDGKFAEFCSMITYCLREYYIL